MESRRHLDLFTARDRVHDALGCLEVRIARRVDAHQDAVPRIVAVAVGVRTSYSEFGASARDTTCQLRPTVCSICMTMSPAVVAWRVCTTISLSGSTSTVVLS